jgi:hypothetical protein
VKKAKAKQMKIVNYQSDTHLRYIEKKEWNAAVHIQERFQKEKMAALKRFKDDY